MIKLPSSKNATSEYSQPVKEERVAGGTSVCVSCWVVRSKIQRPRRENERVVNRRSGRSIEILAVGWVGRLRATAAGRGVGERVERVHRIRVTGICMPVSSTV
jgi:hypothetical protein